MGETQDTLAWWPRRGYLCLDFDSDDPDPEKKIDRWIDSELKT